MPNYGSHITKNIDERVKYFTASWGEEMKKWLLKLFFLNELSLKKETNYFNNFMSLLTNSVVDPVDPYHFDTDPVPGKYQENL